MAVPTEPRNSGMGEMNRQLAIREAGPQDEQSIFKIHQEAIETGCAEHYSREQISSWAVPQGLPPFAELLEASLFLVAELDRRCVGFASRDRNKAKIETLFVAPSFFGQGVGSALLARLEQAIAEAAWGQITVDATLNAVVFYERHGYRVQAQVAHTEPDGTEIECLRMIKRLDEMAG